MFDTDSILNSILAFVARVPGWHSLPPSFTSPKEPLERGRSYFLLVQLFSKPASAAVADGNIWFAWQLVGSFGVRGVQINAMDRSSFRFRSWIDRSCRTPLASMWLTPSRQ